MVVIYIMTPAATVLKVWDSIIQHIYLFNRLVPPRPPAPPCAPYRPCRWDTARHHLYSMQCGTARYVHPSASNPRLCNTPIDLTYCNLTFKDACVLGPTRGQMLMSSEPSKCVHLVCFWKVLLRVTFAVCYF